VPAQRRRGSGASSSRAARRRGTLTHFVHLLFVAMLLTCFFENSAKKPV